MTLGFVVTNYNNSHFTRSLLASLSKVKSIANCHVVIVDNASGEQDREELARICSCAPYVSLILNKENVGYFRGLNVGIEFLKREVPHCNYMIVGNNDLVFPPDIDEMILRNLALFEKYPVVSPDIVTSEGVHQNPHVIKKIGWFRECMYDLYFSSFYFSRAILVLSRWLKFAKRKDSSRHNSSAEIYSGYGACYVLGPLFFKEIKSLWVPTFMYGEEWFLSRQLQRAGFPIFYEPSIEVVHAGHASTGQLPRRELWKIARDSHRFRRHHLG